MLSELADELSAAGFRGSNTQVQLDDVISYFGPFAEPLLAQRFRFTRRWLQQLAPRVPGLARGQEFLDGAVLNCPCRACADVSHGRWHRCGGLPA